MSDKMREEFEAWEASRGYPVDKSAQYPGEYRLGSVQDSWIGYSRAWRNQQAVIDAKNELLAEQEMTISNYMDINEAAGKENGALKDEIAQLRAEIEDLKNLNIELAERGSGS